MGVQGTIRPQGGMPMANIGPGQRVMSPMGGMPGGNMGGGGYDPNARFTSPFSNVGQFQQQNPQLFQPGAMFGANIGPQRRAGGMQPPMGGMQAMPGSQDSFGPGGPYGGGGNALGGFSPQMQQIVQARMGGPTAQQNNMGMQRIADFMRGGGTQQQLMNMANQQGMGGGFGGMPRQVQSGTGMMGGFGMAGGGTGGGNMGGQPSYMTGNYNLPNYGPGYHG